MNLNIEKNWNMSSVEQYWTGSVDVEARCG